MTCGVYAILCLANDKLYIGSSVNIEHRLRSHWDALQKNIHQSHLQAAYNKYGENTFVATILEECDKKMIKKVEQKWIDAYEWDKLFNISPYANHPSGGTSEGAYKIANTRRENGTLGRGGGTSEGAKKAWEARRKRFGLSGGNKHGADSDQVKKMWAKKTPEERSKIALKARDTRRQNAAAKASKSPCN